MRLSPLLLPISLTVLQLQRHSVLPRHLWYATRHEQSTLSADGITDMLAKEGL